MQQKIINSSDNNEDKAFKNILKIVTLRYFPENRITWAEYTHF